MYTARGEVSLPPVPEERSQTAHLALVGLALVVVRSGLVAGA
ncbi:hypothetical protein WME91_52080 [Sorangium sp. So ce269]